MQKLSLHAVASNSQRGLPQRLSQKCLALIIPRIKQASCNASNQAVKSRKKSRSTKTTQKQLRSTQSYSRYKLLLGNSQKASTFLSKRRASPRPIGPSGAKLNWEGETNNYATLHPEQLHGMTQVLYTAPLRPALICRYGRNSPLTWAVLQVGTHELPHERLD